VSLVVPEHNRIEGLQPVRPIGVAVAREQVLFPSVQPLLLVEAGKGIERQPEIAFPRTQGPGQGDGGQAAAFCSVLRDQHPGRAVQQGPPAADLSGRIAAVVDGDHD